MGQESAYTQARSTDRRSYMAGPVIGGAIVISFFVGLLRLARKRQARGDTHGAQAAQDKAIKVKAYEVRKKSQ